ncbi:PUS4_1 [Sanghuangporus weigelae]
MPKSNVPPLPTSALFGIVKPSGPSSMAVINDLKRLVSASKIFMPERVARENAKDLYRKGSDLDAGLRVDKKGREKGKWKKAKGKSRELEAKMGQGGTLDPLADGVLVVGINKGTKKLSEFLDCIKEYRTTCLLGCETDTYDSEGAQVRTAPWRHVTRESIESALEKFCGRIQQTPPVFSALKMDGKPLYEYAREGIPLPRPIERRQVTVHSIELTHWIPGSDHSYNFPEKKFTDEEREKLEKALKGVELPPDAAIKDEPESTSAEYSAGASKEASSPSNGSEENEKLAVERPPTFVLSMRVSGGTYVRSIVHDLGHALGSAAHVVTLTRSKQGRFVLSPSTAVSTPIAPDVHSISTSASVPPETGPSEEVSSTTGEGTKAEAEADGKPKESESVPWDIFARALENRATEKAGPDGWREWEREVLRRLEVVESK